MQIWQLGFHDRALKQFKELPKIAQKRITEFFEKRVLVTLEPMMLASPLTGDMSGLHRFRIGEYRVICNVDKGKLIIVAVAVGHRKDVYKKIHH
jgi:mRNA interferase RelE/StbE